MSIRKSAKSNLKESADESLNVVKKKSVFDHVNHIRQVQDPKYYENLSEEDRKSFNHFMIVRALSMDESLVEDMAQLYQIFDKIPSPQFYQLLIALVPVSRRYYPWIKTKIFRHNKDLISLVAQRFGVSKYQANEYINILLKIENGGAELVYICQSFGLGEKEINDLLEEPKEK